MSRPFEENTEQFVSHSPQRRPKDEGSCEHSTPPEGSYPQRRDSSIMTGPGWSVYVGNTFERTDEIPEKSIHVITSSPPYWSLRAYGTPAVIFGGEPDCDHEWGDSMPSPGNKPGNKPGNTSTSSLTNPMRHHTIHSVLRKAVSGGRFCQKCDAWEGEYGQEPNPDCLAWARSEPPCSSCYVCHTRTLFQKFWRILRDDGSVWWNLGDCYFGPQGRATAPGKEYKEAQVAQKKRTHQHLKTKDLVGIPWRVALALQADGWYWRQEVVWAKSVSGHLKLLSPADEEVSGATMPESTKDRLTRAHEAILFFTKSPDYFFDVVAIKEEISASMRKAIENGPRKKPYVYKHDTDQRMGKASPNGAFHDQRLLDNLANGRRRRDVWTARRENFDGAHFAVWPPDLVIPIVLSSTSEKGCCSTCGAPVVRTDKSIEGQLLDRPIGGWAPSCPCLGATVVPCTVFDPFSGSGTTGKVALQLGRRFVGCELNATYAATMISERVPDGLSTFHPDSPRQSVTLNRFME